VGQRKRSTGAGSTPPGVWNRGAGSGPANPIRVRTKRLDEIESDKIALAYWLLAKQIVTDESDGRDLSEAEVRRVADTLDDAPARPSRARRTARQAATKRRRDGAAS
jgi:hypothetical protein